MDRQPVLDAMDGSRGLTCSIEGGSIGGIHVVFLQEHNLEARKKISMRNPACSMGPVYRALVMSPLALIILISACLAQDGMEIFENRIRPVLATECYTCHGAGKQKGGLRLDFRG